MTDRFPDVAVCCARANLSPLAVHVPHVSEPDPAWRHTKPHKGRKERMNATWDMVRPHMAILHGEITRNGSDLVLLIRQQV